jgi:LysR family hydrogen peroxide-inducible transcriptional activator
MTLTELKYIVAVAREKHFGKAAEACFVSQPTLSLAIKKLEEELEVKLFERSASEVSVTLLGEEIVRQAQSVLEQAAEIKEIAKRGKDPLSGTMRLGVIYTIGPYLLPRLVPILHKRAPRMQLSLAENYTARLTEQLKNGTLDAIVIALPFEAPGVVTAALYDEPFRVVLPRGHEWSGLKKIAAPTLAEQPMLLLGAGNCFRDQVLQVCPRLASSHALQKTFEGSSLETIRHMVESGAGITVLPSGAADGLRSKLLEIKPFSAPEPKRRVALAWRVSFPRHAAIDVLREAIVEAAVPGTLPLKRARSR